MASRYCFTNGVVNLRLHRDALLRQTFKRDSRRRSFVMLIKRYVTVS